LEWQYGGRIVYLLAARKGACEKKYNRIEPARENVEKGGPSEQRHFAPDISFIVVL